MRGFLSQAVIPTTHQPGKTKTQTVKRGFSETPSLSRYNEPLIFPSAQKYKHPPLLIQTRKTSQSQPYLTTTSQRRLLQRRLHLIHSPNNLHPTLNLLNDSVEIVPRPPQPPSPVAKLVVHQRSLAPHVRDSRPLEDVRVLDRYRRL